MAKTAISDLRAAALMTAPAIAVSGSSTVRQAFSRMRRHDVRHLPVVDAHGILAGILSDRDLLRALGRAGGGERKVAAVMTRNVLTAKPTTLARELTALMLDNEIGAVPVVDDDGRLVGMITETDFVRIAHAALGGRIGP